MCVCDQRQIDDSITAHAHKQKPAAGCVNCVFVCVPKQQQTEHFSICFLCCCCFFCFFFFNFLLLRSTNTTTRTNTTTHPHSLTKGTMKNLFAALFRCSLVIFSAFYFAFSSPSLSLLSLHTGASWHLFTRAKKHTTLTHTCKTQSTIITNGKKLLPPCWANYGDGGGKANG